ncbi:MAG: serine/threonine-protein kinase [Myxococcota bacterium]|nr:serine/threonine-protein kinase [Myxococcota bacterium]
MLKPVPFGKYYLLERINVGGMAEVFKAKAFGVEGFERLFAVKKILPQIAADEEFIKMFVDEAKIAVQLNHANIAQIFDLGKVDGAHFIALEYVCGKDLRTIFEAARKLARPWSIRQACFVIMQLCEGLDYAHNKRDSQGIELHLVHRDISPQNILISYEGEIKLIDFGIAKAAGRASKTQAGILKGKFGYMSPEQVRGMGLDRRSDIFSLGIILYELMTHDRLFLAESDFSILEKIRNVEIPPPSQRNPEIPRELEGILMRALAREPEDRYQSAAELHDDLQKFMFTSGLFYTRKDLAGWMHEMFAADIEAEQGKLEEYRLLTPPPGAISRPDIRIAPAEGGGAVPPAPPAGGWPATPPPLPARTPSKPDGLAAASQNTASGVLPWLGQSGGAPGPLPPGLEASGSSSVIGSRPDLVTRSTGFEAPPGLISAPYPPPPAPTSPTNGGGGALVPLGWDDDEAETSVYDRPGRTPSPVEVGDLSEDDIVYSPHRDDHPDPLASLVQTSPRTTPSSRGRLLFLASFTLIALLGAMVVTYVFLSLQSQETSIHLTTIPADGVEILLDGQVIHQGTTPVRIRIQRPEPGPHQLLVRRAGYSEVTQAVTLAADQESVLELTLQPLTQPGTLRLVTTPAGASVQVDGQPWDGRTPLTIEGLAPGPHDVVLTLAGYEPWSQRIEMPPGGALQRTLLLKAATVDLNLVSQPAGARYSLQVLPEGEVRTGTTPEQVLALPAGTQVEISVEQRGYLRWQQTVALPEAGGRTEVTAELTAVKLPGPAPRPGGRAHPPGGRPQPAPVAGGALRPTPPPPRPPAPPPPAVAAAPGFLRLQAVPFARVFVDGTDIGETPIVRHSLDPGKHRITLVNNKLAGKITFEVEIRANEVNFVKKVDWVGN